MSIAEIMKKVIEFSDGDIASLREKYDLHMTVERFVSAKTPESEDRFIRK